MVTFLNPIKKFLFPNPELETKLAEASNALRGEFRRIHAHRVDLYNQIRDIENAPPTRADLAQFLTAFVDGVLNNEPNGKRVRLLNRLASFKNSGLDPTTVQASWQAGFSSGLDDYDDVFFSLLGETLKSNAATLAANLPWPDGGMPAADRIAKVEALRAEADELLQQINELETRAQRLNINLATE